MIGCVPPPTPNARSSCPPTTTGTSTSKEDDHDEMINEQQNKDKEASSFLRSIDTSNAPPPSHRVPFQPAYSGSTDSPLVVDLTKDGGNNSTNVGLEQEETEGNVLLPPNVDDDNRANDDRTDEQQQREEDEEVVDAIEVTAFVFYVGEISSYQLKREQRFSDDLSVVYVTNDAKFVTLTIAGRNEKYYSFHYRKENRSAPTISHWKHREYLDEYTVKHADKLYRYQLLGAVQISMLLQVATFSSFFILSL
jgi:hypothetical protein